MITRSRSSPGSSRSLSLSALLGTPVLHGLESGRSRTNETLSVWLLIRRSARQLSDRWDCASAFSGSWQTHRAPTNMLFYPHIVHTGPARQYNIARRTVERAVIMAIAVTVFRHKSCGCGCSKSGQSLVSGSFAFTNRRSCRTMRGCPASRELSIPARFTTL